MLAQDILPWVQAVPFVPFRIRMGGGTTYDLRHPELIRLTRTTAYVFSRTGDEDLGQLERMIGVGLIEEVGPIPAATRPADPSPTPGVPDR